MEKLGIDLGNSSMKIVGGDRENLIFKRIRSLATTESEDTNHVVTFNGETVCFGVGETLVEHDKTERKYLEHSILLAVYEIYGPGEHEIDLGMSLPISFYKHKKDSFKQKIESFKNLKGYVNGRSVSVNLEKVIIQAEGLAAFYALMPEIPKGPILFIDLGHRTTDIIAANVDTETGKWKLEGDLPIQKGGYELINKLQEALIPKTNEFFSVQQIEQFIASGGRIGTLQIDTLYQEALQETINGMCKQIHQKFNDMLYREIYICGGAAPMFAACYHGDNLTVIKEDKMIYSNAVGSYLKL